MIRQHDFNTRWWGAPVGIVDDVSFFAGNQEARARDLAPWAWVELRAPSSAMLDVEALRANGFAHVDTQIHFRIDLKRAAREIGDSARALEVTSADQRDDFVIERVASFDAERYRALPGITSARLAARYETWARSLAAAHPEWALAVASQGVIQGWFLAEPTDGPLKLTLAMLAENARISGALLYGRALAAYAERGAHLGEASFSARNVAVLNVYASLEARFTHTTEHWIRFAP